MDVVPIRVKIGLRPNGHADHPAWEQLPTIAAAVALINRPTREQIDGVIKPHVLGGWHYDKTSGHDQETADSPRGQQWGMLLVSRLFATEALATFPTLVTELTKTQAIAFYNQRTTIGLSDEREQTEILTALKARRDLMVAVGLSTAALDARILKALDPTDTEPGVAANPLRRFATAASRWGLTWDASVLP